MKQLIAITAMLALTSCMNDDPTTLDNQLYTLGGHVEKSASLRGSFCNGEPYKWYYQGKSFIAGTCQNGMVFHLPLKED